MKHRPLKLGTAVLVGALLVGAFSFSLVSYSDGSDPLVTLSYLTEIILPQFKKDVLMEIAKGEADNTDSMETDSETFNDSDNIDESDNSEDSIPQNNSYTLLELEFGQKLYAESVLELIVRPGSEVCVISPFEEQGIANITGSKEYLNGDTIEHNAYCLIPRGGDGRGIEVLNEKSYILVRGEYSVG